MFKRYFPKIKIQQTFHWQWEKKRCCIYFVVLTSDWSWKLASASNWKTENFLNWGWFLGHTQWHQLRFPTGTHIKISMISIYLLADVIKSWKICVGFTLDHGIDNGNKVENWTKNHDWNIDNFPIKKTCIHVILFCILFIYIKR